VLSELLRDPGNLTVLCAVAHCDDETILCGGLLARVASQGGRAVAHVVCGLEAHRRVELMAACERLGAEAQVLEYQDGALTNASAPEIVDELVRTIRMVKPDLIVTHDPEFDYNADHLWLAERVVYASQKAGMNEAGHRPRLVLGGEIHTPLPFPDYLIDVGAQMPTVLEALACHESQLAATHKRGYYMRLVETRARWRGVQAGCEYALALRRLPLPVIGDLYAAPLAV
jgi:LmbE family N-acetylglucosaminyl deacetylase